MLIWPLPHPGYTWSFSQHAAGFDESTIWGMLSCASLYEGQTDVGPRITNLMIQSGLLTPNERDGKADAWRDYQQILSELGLIVSTKLSSELRLTNASRAFVAGEIQFHELMRMQVFRYQYPNGQKHDRSTKVRKALADDGMQVPDSLIDLHVQSGVLIKPGLLVLQVLLELLELGELPEVKIDECRAILLPCKTNAEAGSAASTIMKARATSVDLSDIHVEASKRNIQDWFKILDTTGLFDTDGKTYMRLSEQAAEQAQDLQLMCASQSDPRTYWLPNGSAPEERVTWFDHFGSYEDVFEDLRLPTSSGQFDDVDRVSEDDTDAGDSISTTGPVRLVEFDRGQLFTREAPDPSASIEDLAQRVIDGAIKRHAKTVLHDQIVLRYAERYLAQGAEVKVDPNSVDLFVKWSPEESAIFEVKTVSQRSLPARMRLAVGQVKEYAYRLEADVGHKPEQAIIIDRRVKVDSWRRNFLNEYMNIGLICTLPSDEQIFAPTSSITGRNWAG
jgi:hypothetical protein